MTDDLIAIFEDIIKAFEGAKKLTPQADADVIKPLEDAAERIKNILHIHSGQGAQILQKAKAEVKLEKCKELIDRLEKVLPAA